MNYLYRLIAFVCTLAIVSLTTDNYAQQEPDSVYTREYIEQISFTEPHRALKLIDDMEARRSMSPSRLDQMRSTVYQNGLNMYRTALSYSLKAYHADSLHRHSDETLLLLELITDQYYTTGNYTESTRYAIKGIELAKQTGDKNSEANLLLYIGMNKRDMGLKDEADKYVEQALQMQEKETEGSHAWGAVDDLIYIYGIKITYAFEDRKYREAISLLPRYEKLMEQFKACPDIPDGVYDMRRANVCAAFASIFAENGQPDKAAEFYRQFEETDYASTQDGIQMRFDYLIAAGRYREALQAIHTDKQYWKEQADTVNYFYLEYDLQSEAKAYMGLGNYKAAAQTYRQMYTLSDSLRLREKRNGVLDFATLYETKEKEAQLVEQAAQLREHRIFLLFAACVIGLLGVLLWRNVRHSRIIKAKNRTMAGKIDNLLEYKEELFRRKEENLQLAEQLQATESELQQRDKATRLLAPQAPLTENESSVSDEPSDTDDIDRALFDKLEREIISRKLFLQPESPREGLIEQMHIPQNKFPKLFKRYARTNFSQYLNNLRLDYATRMLKEHPEYTVETISQECGFKNPPNFYKLFSEQFSMTPAEYRDSRNLL